MNKNSGFTLIELMVVIVVIAILAGVAIPSYQQHVLRSNRTEGQALLAEAAARQERFFTQNNRYATTIAELAYYTADSRSALYQLVIVANPDPMEFDLQAIPINRQTADSGCGILGINHAGVRIVTGSTGVAQCWK